MSDDNETGIGGLVRGSEQTILESDVQSGPWQLVSRTFYVLTAPHVFAERIEISGLTQEVEATA